jgi:5-methylthioadenosine/S-adenosylhomocysteine deaminase
VALGTDGATANNDLDLLAEARIAGLLSAGIAATPGDLVAGDMVRMATLEGARALGLGEVAGSLLPGKWADLCCINLRAARSWPVHDVATAVIFAASSQQVTDTWVAGRRLLADSRLTLLDESATLDRAEAWRSRLDADADPEARSDE